MELTKLVEVLYLYTRKSPLTADQHDECKSIALKLIEHLKPQEQPKEKKEKV